MTIIDLRQILEQQKYALIVLNPPFRAEYQDWVKSIFNKAVVRISADGAAGQLLDYGLIPDFAVGDMDSITHDVLQKLKSSGSNCEIVQSDDQDTTDFQKCLSHLHGLSHLMFDYLIIIGGIGDRFDQSMSTIHTLYQYPHSFTNFQVPSLILDLKDSNWMCLLQQGDHNVLYHNDWYQGRVCGLIPFIGDAVISTTGLQWDVNEWRTSIGSQISTSNLIKEDVVKDGQCGAYCVKITVHSDVPILWTAQLNPPKNT
ncbi:hypothetical protein MIR68_010333 [Amoeboaphelidium protococcarum]|nr:hypothetical protein MIR68_010333 [Amoeboaphelidium protococcarum]